MRNWAACMDAQVKGFFMSLFIASTGLIMSPRFLAAHLPVLAAGMFLVVLGKSILVRLMLTQLGKREVSEAQIPVDWGLCSATFLNRDRRAKFPIVIPRGHRTISSVCAQMQISLVVWMFQYPPRTAAAVGLSMAQIGEFAFVLLSSASQHGLLAYQVYMLLMGAFSGLVMPCIEFAC